MAEPLIRREPRASNGWNNGDLDVAYQLLTCGMVWDGNLVSKDSRNHLVANGYAVRHDGMQSLTGRGVVAFLTHRAAWAMLWRRWWRYGGNPLVASEATVKRAMT